MDLTLTLELESPLLVGARRLGAQDAPTLDYVPGGVLRATFARAILEQCPYFDRNSQEGRRYWVTYRDGPACRQCPWRRWCAAFGQVRFGHAHPQGAEVLPQTAMACKHQGTAHPLTDTLIAAVRLRETLRPAAGEGSGPMLRGDLATTVPRCRACQGRMERLEGYWDGQRTVHVPRTLLRRVGLDPWRHTAAEGILYGLQVVRECHPDGRPVEFRAPLSFPADGERIPPSLPVDQLAVGARTSSGLGRCRVRLQPAAATGAEAEFRRRVEAFTQRLRAPGTTPPVPAGTYVALTLQTEAKCSLLARSELPYQVTSETFRQALAQALGLPLQEGWTLRHVFATYTHWGGWDTSAPGGALKPQTLRVQRGSVLVLHHPCEPHKAPLDSLVALALKGLGEDTQNGYGRVSICDPLHVEYGQEG